MEHTLFKCPRWTQNRSEFINYSKTEFNILNMMKVLLTDEEGWLITYKVIRSIIEKKEEEYREIRRNIRNYRRGRKSRKEFGSLPYRLKYCFNKG